MSRLVGILFVVAVVILAMAFAAANAGQRVTLDLGILTLYRVPITLVAFTGLLAGMLVMFATGIHTDLKVRRILRERLEEEAREERGEQAFVDRAQRDLFSQEPEPETLSNPVRRARDEETAPAAPGAQEEEPAPSPETVEPVARFPVVTEEETEPTEDPRPAGPDEPEEESDPK